MTNPNSRAADGWTKKEGHCSAPWCASVSGILSTLYCTGSICTVQYGEYCKQKCVHSIYFLAGCGCGPPSTKAVDALHPRRSSHRASPYRSPTAGTYVAQPCSRRHPISLKYQPRHRTQWSRSGPRVYRSASPRPRREAPCPRTYLFFFFFFYTSIRSSISK